MHHVKLRLGCSTHTQHQCCPMISCGGYPKAAAGRSARPIVISRAQKAHGDTSTSQEAADLQQQQQQEEQASSFSTIVQRLLHRAASSLTRGTTTCLACQGRGTCSCPGCNGSGVTAKDARQNVMRHTAQKLRSVLQVERSEYHSDWLTSNRCRRCHGTGVMMCPTCQGLGTRHASGVKGPAP